MHYHCEIIMPPIVHHMTLECAVQQVMHPFNEEWNPSFQAIKEVIEKGEDDESYEIISELVYQQKYAFWDWYQIGGRWSQNPGKLGLDECRLKAFYAALKDLKVTVSGLQMGKQELSPPSQAKDVDALWKELFPEWPDEHCPLFQHSGQGNEFDKPGNVMRVGDASLSTLNPQRVLFADWKTEYNPKKPEGERMVLKRPRELACKTYGSFELNEGQSVADVISTHRREPFPDDWLIVTVDYHN